MRPSYIKQILEEEMTLKDIIEDALFYREPGLTIRKIIRFIKKLFRWIPILWNYEEWDFRSFYDIIKLHLTQLRKEIDDDKVHTPECVIEELKQIDSVLDHLDKYLNCHNYIEIPEPPEGFERFTPTENGYYTMNMTDEEHKAYEKMSKFEQKHYKAFWNELRDNSSNWWV